jgi:hypothetical protein
MNFFWKRTAISGALCLGLAAVGSVSLAQDHPPPPGAGQHDPGMAGMPGMDRGKAMEAMRARREKTLHDVLNIKPDQETAFHTYLTAIAPSPRQGDAAGRPDRDRGPEGAAMTTPQRLDQMAARMAERQTRFQQAAAATKTFYAALNADQRRAFDALPMMMGGRMDHGGHMGRGPMMMGR